MIEKVFLKLGANRSIALTTLFAIASSMAIATLIWTIFGLPNMPSVLLIAFICPVVISPPVAWTYAQLILKLHQNRLELQKKNEELARLMQEMKTLGSMLPICASCRKIRDDGGYWRQLEAYLETHAKVEFSHGLCPDCSRALYPQLYEQGDQPKPGATTSAGRAIGPSVEATPEPEAVHPS